MARTVAVLDANVLYGIVPTDLLVTLAIHGAYRAHWSTKIRDEAARNVIANRPDLDRAKVKRRFELMNIALDNAEAAPPDAALVGAMTNHPGDRHVLATAVTVSADVIVTENRRHFPATACAPLGIVAMSLDDFIGELLDEQPHVVVDALTEMAGRRTRPTTTTTELLTILSRYAPTSAQRLQHR